MLLVVYAFLAGVIVWTIGAAVSLGGAVYAWPAHPRLGPDGDALVIPSTLTLELPLVALLALALAPIPEQVAKDREPS